MASTSSHVGFWLLLCFSFCSATRLLINPTNAGNPSSARSLAALQSEAPAGDDATPPTLPTSSDSKWSSATKSGHYAAGGCGGYWVNNWCGCGGGCGGGGGGSYSGSCCGPPPAPSCCQPVPNCYPVTCPPVSNCYPPPPPPPPTCCSTPCQPPSGCCSGCPPPLYGPPAGSATEQSRAETQSTGPESDAKKHEQDSLPNDHDVKEVESKMQERGIESDGKMQKENDTENESISM